MKKIVLFLFLVNTKVFCQEAKTNVSDSCIISDGTMSVKDFKNMRRICPPKLTRITSFVISYKSGANLAQFTVTGNGWWYKLTQGMKSGTKIYFEDIKGFDPEGHHVKIPDMTIVLK